MKEWVPKHHRKKSTISRMQEKIELIPFSTCWFWVGFVNPDGYGSFHWNGKSRPAHRAVYELLRGAIEPGLAIDHLCRVRSCVNPDHLEPVTRRENVLRGESPLARVVRSNKCVSGHELSEENVYINKKSGQRCCRKCRSRRNAAYKNRIRERRNDPIS